MKRSISRSHCHLKRPSITRAEDVDESPPYYELESKIDSGSINAYPRNIVFWFRGSDLRIEDNRGLSRAAQLAGEMEHKNSCKLAALFVLQPSELDFHGVGRARRALISDGLNLLKEQLHERLNIKLNIVISKSRRDTANLVLEFAKDADASHVFANYQYEFDELNRDIATYDTLKENGVDFKLEHDQTVVPPGEVTTAEHTPRQVFTSYWNEWIPIIAKSPDQYYLMPAPIEKTQEEVFTVNGYPDVNIDETLGIIERGGDLQKILKLWPVGHDVAVDRLRHFLKTKIHHYAAQRSNPAKECTSRMSPYFVLGMISIREALALTRKEANGNKNFGTGSGGVDAWVREIAFREFYRQLVACCVPHIVMNMPNSLRFANIEYEEDEEAWKRWCDGTTGVPFIDAGMRQLNTEGYMHNRARMNTASYLRMNLLLDYRRGMHYFANKLVDWDCCNNTFGWDPNYTVFNPVLQAEKNDPNGDYIRKWVPELRDVEGKAVFDPSGRLPANEFRKLNYPSPIIDHETAKKRSIDRYREATQVKKRIKPETD